MCVSPPSENQDYQNRRSQCRVFCFFTIKAHMYDCGSGQTNQPSLLLLLRPIQFNCVCVSMFVFSQCRVGCVVSYRSCCSVHLFGGNPSRIL